MRASFRSILPLLAFSCILFYACSNDCSSCCNETDAMYGEERDVDGQAMQSTSVNAGGNTQADRSKRKTSVSRRNNTAGTPGEPASAPAKGDPENSGNGNGDNSSGLNSSGENIGNKNSVNTNPSKGAPGSATPQVSRGNSGQGRPY